MAWLELLSYVGTGSYRPEPIRKHFSSCVHAQSFPGKFANQLAASDSVHTCRPSHAQPLRPPLVQINPVIWACDTAFGRLFRSQRSSLVEVRVLDDYSHTTTSHI